MRARTPPLTTSEKRFWGSRKGGTGLPGGIRPHFLFEASKRKRLRPVKRKDACDKRRTKWSSFLSIRGSCESALPYGEIFLPSASYPLPLLTLPPRIRWCRRQTGCVDASDLLLFSCVLLYKQIAPDIRFSGHVPPRRPVPAAAAPADRDSALSERHAPAPPSARRPTAAR